MDYEKAVIEFLAHKDNLPFVLEIGERVEQIKKKLHTRFWKIIKNILQGLLNESSYSNKWDIQIDDNLFSSWSGLTFIPISNTNLHIRPRIEQGSGDLNIFYGIQWSQENRDPITINKLKVFQTQLKNDGLAGSDAWWIAYKKTNIRPSNKDFLMKISSNANSVANDVAILVWELFSNNIQSIEEINQLIKNNNKKA